MSEGAAFSEDRLLGQTVSHYRITARIGAGGMGEVYRATRTTAARSPTSHARAAV
jgi:hypothetical protein